MPIYEYKCGACAEVFEYSQRMADDPKTICETCGGPLERLISRTAFQLKGSGWYKDLYSSPKPGTGDKSAATSGSDAGGGEKKSAAPASSSDSASSPAPAAKSESPAKAGGGKDT
jgi:putative FmdB family regulatory protein